MSQISEDVARSLSVRCSDVGLDCNCVISGMSETQVMDMTVSHMFEYHAINPEEMTTCMKTKIRENMRESCTSVDTFLRAQHAITKVF
jgi:predicted small metal-binding protein